ncbi:endolytic transglycosylase MltG [Endozoicomonas sp. OPT23]|uniref:endolytic transglycosylase MltG n=1 Tax=Endozoicomonas sp. OPT23 TaxID=2072845 RepID=UPI00129B75ED|nr:endolytic transglycosylase MltG [Endozoicomonas sp. OPT23]MRI35218.1 endolytic transglycosylase MltG [Endozoicomonas sp. OPT23]
MLKKILLAAIAGMLLLAIAVGVAWKLMDDFGNQPVEAPEGVKSLEFTIETGDSMKRVAARLSSEGWLETPEFLEVLARLEKVAVRIKAGEYLIPAGVTHRELLQLFTEGQVRSFEVSLIEGQALMEALEELNSQEKLSEPLDQKAFQTLLKELGIAGNPEGLFYPDTFFFHSGDTVTSILIRSRERMKEVLAEEWQNRAKDLPYKSAYEALVMASLIEKETGVTYERPEIAGVFVRRLQKGMRLQTDPAVIYGQGENYKGNLTRRMLREKTPYNTYMLKGLPPTPIAFVGREAINAALHPKDGKSLYFVAKGDGTHYFSNSLVEHNRAVRKYQIYQRRSDYRSSQSAPVENQ